MIQSQSGIENVSEDEPCYFDFEEDEIFEQSIDDYDEAMDNDDDGIAHSELEDSYDEDLADDQSDNRDFDDWDSPTQEPTDEIDDYDELEE